MRARHSMVWHGMAHLVAFDEWPVHVLFSLVQAYVSEFGGQKEFASSALQGYFMKFMFTPHEAAKRENLRYLSAMEVFSSKVQVRGCLLHLLHLLYRNPVHYLSFTPGYLMSCLTFLSHILNLISRLAHLLNSMHIVYCR